MRWVRKARELDLLEADRAGVRRASGAVAA